METDFWHGWQTGQRVSVRYRIESGFSDALGYIRRLDSTGMDVETRRGIITVPAEKIVRGKLVPPPPQRRQRPAPTWVIADTHPDPET